MLRTHPTASAQQELKLPVPYFLLTFTMPEGLWGIERWRQKTTYDLLFRASAAATQQLAQDSRLVGGRIGMIGVLHTWGRDLNHYPHVHYLVPGGGRSFTPLEKWMRKYNSLLSGQPLPILTGAG